MSGASGMVGANLCLRLLAEGIAVRALVRRPLDHPLLADADVESAVGDISQRDTLRSATRGCQVVFHVAGMISYRDRDRRQLFEINAAAPRRIVEAAAAAGVERVVLTSSTAAVGICRPGEQPLDEAAEFRRGYQANPYMASKRAGEDDVLTFPDADVVAVNPATILGGGDIKANTGVVFQRLAAGKLNWIPPGGTALVSVSDVVAGHLLAWRNGAAGRRYILATANHSFAEMFGEIARQLGVAGPRRRLPSWLYSPAYAALRVNDACGGPLGVSRHVLTIAFRNRYFAADRARRELAWQPRQDLPAMVGEAIDFYRQHGLL
ncbi:MAG: NAD-dependent epimerase/dehydratase family protein [Pirellulaceae bacterium]|nr:NAD-dependent epimerase/dehydratase family protein [Pirellulaceae bacterium]